MKYQLFRKGESFRFRLVKTLRLFFSFAMEGEDKILLDLLPERGTYLDIGAHHPFWGSNTALLYLRGWFGVNVDKKGKWQFKLFRPRDKFIYGYFPDIDVSKFKGYDLLDIDTDGLEVEILKNILPFYTPPYAIIENNCFPEQYGVDELMTFYGYKKVCQTTRNGIYEHLHNIQR